MKEKLLLEALGCESSNEKVINLLQQVNYTKPLKIPYGDYSTYTEIPSLGLALLFEDESIVDGIKNQFPEGSLILTACFLYSGKTKEYKQYKYEIPFGIKFENTRSTIIDKLGKEKTHSESFCSSTWVIDNLSVNIDFTEKYNEIIMIQISPIF